MTTRAELIAHALKDNGYLDGCGYPGPGNRMDTHLGRGNEYWCGDTVTTWFAEMGIPLPLMQQGMAGKQTGFAYCPDAVNYARTRGAVINSTKAQPGDIFLFDWNGDGVADHTEICVGDSEVGKRTIGGDSGPSNVDGHTGEGGVHLHDWPVPSNQILAVIDASKFVTFTTTQEDPPVTDAQMKQILDAINHLGSLLEGSRDASGKDTDPTHESLRDLSAKLDQLLAR